MILAGNKSIGQNNLSHEKFKGILQELKSGTRNLLKRVSTEQLPWLKILDGYLESIRADEKLIRQMLVKLSHALTKQYSK